MTPLSDIDPLLESFLNDPQEAVVGYDTAGRIFIWNAAAEALYGYSRQEMIGVPLKRLLPLHELGDHPEESSEAAPDEGSEIVSDRVTKKGVRLAVRLRRRAIRAATGELTGIVERSYLSPCGSPISPAEHHLRTLVEQMPLICWITDAKLRVTSVFGSRNWGGRRATGQSIHEFLSPGENSLPAVKSHLDALRGRASRLEYRREGHVFDLSVEPLRDANSRVVGCAGMALDVTERVKSEEEVKFRATHDGLTGLANYREFIERLEHEVRRSDRTRASFGVLLLDLDDLKVINDRYGHLAGNQALRSLALIMREYCRATDVAARYGGDEFAMLLLDADRERAEGVAERIRAHLASRTEPPTLSASMGVSVYPADGVSGAQLLEAADKRLYKSKRARVRTKTTDAPQSEKAAGR